MEMRSPLISSPEVYNLEDTSRCKIDIRNNLIVSGVLYYYTNDNTKPRNCENKTVGTCADELMNNKTRWLQPPGFGQSFERTSLPSPTAIVSKLSLLLGSTCSSSESENESGVI